MPTVIDTPERPEHVETHALTPHDLHREKPHARGANPGFWRTLAHGITQRLTDTPRERHTPSCPVPRPFETPMDRFTREHLSLSLLALALI
jgi:hypothetical protein